MAVNDWTPPEFTRPTGWSFRVLDGQRFVSGHVMLWDQVGGDRSRAGASGPFDGTARTRDGAPCADLRVGEDDFGIWAAGPVHQNAPDGAESLVPSGIWDPYGRLLDIVMVPIPGILAGPPPPPVDDRSRRWLTTKEAAELLGINDRTLIRWERDGVISSHRFHPTAQRKWDADAIQRFIEQKESAAPQHEHTCAKHWTHQGPCVCSVCSFEWQEEER